MNTIPRLAGIRTIVIALSLLAAGVAHASTFVQDSLSSGGNAPQRCGGGTVLTGLDARVVEKAAQGVGALRQYVWLTRSIYQLDLSETIAWLDQERAAAAACGADASPAAGR